MDTARNSKKLWLRQSSLNYWKNAPKMNHAKRLILKPEKKSSETLLSMSRLQLRIVTMFLTGHGIFRAHLHKLGLSTDKLCRFCGIDDETAEHLLCYCNRFEYVRSSIFGNSTMTE